MLKQTLSTNEAAYMLRQDEHASWHKDAEASFAMAEYMENLSNELGEDLEVDPDAWRCDFAVYDSVEEFNAAYNTNCEDLDDVSRCTQIIQLNNGRFIAKEL